MTTNEIPFFETPDDHDYVTALLAYADALNMNHRDAARIICTSAAIDTDDDALALYDAHDLAMRDAAQRCYVVVSLADGREYCSYDTYDDICAELHERDLI